MALRTMSLITLPLAYVAVITTTAVHFMSDGLEVGWAHASRLAAEMVQLKALRDRSVLSFITPTMGQDVTPRAIRTTADLEMAITIGNLSGGPKPAWAKVGAVLGNRAALINFSPETLFNRYFGFSHIIAPKIGVTPV